MLQSQAIHNFERTARFLYVPTNGEEYDQLVELLDELIDMVRDNEDHPLANLIDVVGVLVETYENEHVPTPTSDPVSVLQHFMEEYDLKRKDLPELGSERVVSEILSRHRELNVRQVKALSERFRVPSSVFI